jgi:hypothetical protein
LSNVYAEKMWLEKSIRLVFPITGDWQRLTRGTELKREKKKKKKKKLLPNELGREGQENCSVQRWEVKALPQRPGLREAF